MKLCMVNGFFHPFIGGSEKHMYELGRRLAMDNDVHVVTSRLDDTPEFEVIEGMQVHRLATRHKKLPAIYPPPLPITRGVEVKLEKLDGETNFDAFNLHGRWFPNWNRVVEYANKKGKLMVHTLHNQRPLGISPVVSFTGTVYDSVFGKRVLHNVDRIISVSAAAKVDIMNYGIEADKIEVIHNGVDTNFYKPSEPTYHEKYRDGMDNLLIFVGRIIEQKGLRYLIEAMPEVLKEHPKTRLLITGKGKFKDRHIQEVKKLGLEDNIMFPGFVPEEEMPNLYSSADIFVLPSLWEVFPIAMLEALASGAPLMASDAGGNAEMIEQDGNGRVCERGNTKALADDLRIMLDDPNKLRSMGQRSREIAVERFDWDIITKKTRTHYRNMMSDFYN